ncbi:MAG TPA: hypothetical protein VF434_07835, partial [Promineifilum sp.]
LHGVLRRRWTRQDSIHLLVTGALTVLVALPLWRYAQLHPGALTVRIRQASVVDTSLPLSEQVKTLAVQATSALLTYSVRGDTDPQFTIPGRPSLNPFLSAAFLLGIVLSLWRFRRPPYPLLLAWLAIMTAPAMVADLAAMAKRSLGAFPAVMMLIALGLLVPLDALGRREEMNPGTRRLAILLGALLVAGVVYSGVRTYRDYFVIWAADPDLATHFQVDHQIIGRAIGAVPSITPVWLSPYPPDQPVIQFHGGLLPELRGYNGRFCVPYASPTGDNGLTYFIVPGLQDHSLSALQELFPEGVTENGPLRPGSDRAYFQTFSVDPHAVAVGIPDEAVTAWDIPIELLSYEVNESGLSPGSSLELNLTYRAVDDLALDYTAFVHLLGPPRPSDGSPLWAQSDSPPCGGSLPTHLWRAGDIVQDKIVLQLPADLTGGHYQLVTGFYTLPDVTRVTLADSSDDSWLLSEFLMDRP